MLNKKINLELIVPADDAAAVLSGLNMASTEWKSASHLFGGGAETVLIEHSGMRRKSALAHTLSASKVAVGAVKTARNRVSAALHLVV